MFNDLPLCCDYSATATAAAGAGAPVNTLPAVSGYTVTGRTVPFPMVDPYRPVSRARVPVSGYNRFPVPRPLGRKYYGLSGDGKRGFRGMGGDSGGGAPFILVPGDGPPTWDAPEIIRQGVTLPRQQSTLQAILNAILPAAPAIISAARGNPYYNPAQLVPAQQPVQTVYGTQVGNAQGLTSAGATAGAAVGNLGAAAMQIITENPLLVLGAGVGLVLLFKESPRRR